MPIMIGRRRIVGDIAGMPARPRDNASHCTEEVLVSDLERFGSGEMPNAEELEAPPLLDPFAITTRSLPCLPRNVAHSLQRSRVGDGADGNGGHPILKGPTVTTSEVWALAPELGWARTYSRLYPLQSYALREGRPMRPGHAG